ncbi:23S rRNA (adenine(1618)-N(6))-methyltransferase RlmF [Reinekea sp.]|jgi:23S rRNA (adenine1618-N6)-methyltransferase|uniref:23S rRNA (adenine(1618)-N(6))-methyltransferase RlmF n=1 Tax=Reinekea sp. TaxID=1970455 RepID=UPI002A7F887E|nr:23S rRNA (adenine(1618)-N(6))-methyltransferase RlmF [Reinekea sp.]
MTAKKPVTGPLHRRNNHQGRYDLVLLAGSYAPLADFFVQNPVAQLTIDFANPEAVLALNRALLAHFYGIQHWSIPTGYLCPPIPGRADYLHYAADLLGPKHGGHGAAGRILDIGTGANLIYPIIGSQVYGWNFVATDIDPVSIAAAQAIISANSQLKPKVELRLQSRPERIFSGCIKAEDRFFLTVCNPPFHKSMADATAGTRRKVSNLSKNKAPQGLPRLNFGGQETELWCKGGELGFIQNMIRESGDFQEQVGWFTCLVSKQEHIKALQKAIATLPVQDCRVVRMAQGQKNSRFLAWTFKTRAQLARI